MKILDEFNFSSLYKNTLFKLTVVTIIITLYLLIDQVYVGVPYYDVFVYLNNALIYAGIPVGNLSVIYLPPLMPFLTSLFFRLGLISSNIIFIIDGVIFVFGVIGLYLLLRERFNEIQSSIGCLIFISSPLIYSWAVSGGIDVPGVCFSIWAVYFLVNGIRNNNNYLYLVLPMLSLAFLTRYTAVMLVFPILLYLLINNTNLISNIKKLVISLLPSAMIVTPFLTYFYLNLGNLNALINLFISTSSNSSAPVQDVGYNPDRLYYLTHILNYISVGPFTGLYNQLLTPSIGFPTILSYITIAILVVGLGIYLYRILLKGKIQGTFSSNKVKTYNCLIILIILSVVGVFSFFLESYIVTEFVILLALFTGYILLKDINVKNLEIDFLFLSWFVAFFIFHSVIILKVDRYFITMIPALTYFTLLAFSVIIEKYKVKFKQESLRTWGLYVIVGLIFITSATAVHTGHSFIHGYGYSVQSASDWLEEYDPNYENERIYSNYDPAFTWALKKEVIFGVPSEYNNSTTFSQYLTNNSADYYLDVYTEPKIDIPGYHIIKNVSTIAIYQKN
ncbi:MAG: glycosyltransferase family 39 protein [Methanobacterium sp.]